MCTYNWRSDIVRSFVCFTIFTSLEIKFEHLSDYVSTYDREKSSEQQEFDDDGSADADDDDSIAATVTILSFNDQH